MNKAVLLTATALAVMTIASPGYAQSRTAPSELGYFLPRARIAATVQQIIRRCPADGELPRIETTIAIAERAGADPAAFVRVDLGGGGLTARSTKFGLRPDGTLSAFNATSTGEAGQVLSAIVSLGATVATLGAGGIAPTFFERAPTLTCTEETAARVRRMAQVENDLANLRSRIAQGHESAATAEALAGLTAELTELVNRLTLKTALAPFAPGSGDFQAPAAGSPRRLVRPIKAINYETWFVERGAPLQQGLAAARVLGINGFRASAMPDEPMLAVLAGGDGSAAPANLPTRRFYYRRPVPVSVSVVPCLSPWTASDCPPDENAAASAQKSVMLPQLSGIFSLPIGRSNLFGTRATSATFDEQGAPLTLEYGATVGGPDMAAAINAVNAGMVTFRDAETAANTRRIAELKAERELRAMLADPTLR